MHMYIYIFLYLAVDPWFPLLSFPFLPFTPSSVRTWLTLSDATVGITTHNKKRW